jgi:PAS domain S-box-containing protein
MSSICGLRGEWFYGDPSTWVEIVHPDDRHKIGPIWRASVEGRAKAFEIECRVIRPNGTIRWVAVSGTAIRNVTGDIVRMGGMIKDITEARELETQLRQAQKIESVGQLAGGIAHDFNNLLTVINGFADLAASGLVEDDPVRADLQEIGRAGTRAAALTRQLLAFSRKQVLQPTVFSPNTVISDMVGMLRRLIGAHIELKLEADMNLACVRADYGQAEQVLLNLVVNARDAMPKGGTITITTRNIEIAETDHPSCPPGRYVIVQVTDTGIGMDETIRARIFEPFFTTKEVGKGTGLGLATVYGIVKQSGATVGVESELGRGTTFSIYFPRVDEPAQDRRAARGELANRGTETILLVEDEESLRLLAERVLEAAGYKVLAASNGAEALSTVEAYAAPLHLLITDVIIPGMMIGELTGRMKAIHPETRVLFMSGYNDDTVARQGVLDEGAHFIAKPYSPRDLRTKVREVLSANLD